MATISKIKFNGTTYDLADNLARSGVNNLSTALEDKADKSNVYTKAESDAKYATKAALNDKADASSVNSRFESVSNLLSSKANVDDVYDKEAADDRFVNQIVMNNYKTIESYNEDLVGVQGEWMAKIEGVQGDVANVVTRLEAIESSTETLETLQKINKELQDPDNEAGLESFLDVVKSAMNKGNVEDTDTQYTFNFKQPIDPETGLPISDEAGTLEISSNTITKSKVVWVPQEEVEP